MNHILKKIAIAGAGGSNKPKPPIYKPPVLGGLQYGSSFSFAETIDLISDGPIEGMVDRHGRVLEGLRILQGIYFDDTPVAVSNKPVDNTLNFLEEDAAEELNCELSSGEGTAIKNCQKFFEELSFAKDRSTNAKVSTLRRSTAVLSHGQHLESLMWPHAPLYFTWEQRYYTTAGHSSGPTIARLETWEKGRFNFWLRAFIKSRTSPELTFPWYFNDVLQTAENRDANALFQQDNFLFKRLPQNLCWRDDSTAETSNLMLAPHSANLFYVRRHITLSRDRDHLRAHGINIGRLGGGRWWARNDALFPDQLNKIQDFVQTELEEIHDLWEEGQSVDGNKLQAALAEKALSSLGWGVDSDEGLDTLIENAVPTAEDDRFFLLVVVKVNETDNDELNKDLIAEGTGENRKLQNMVTRPYGGARPWALESELAGEGVEFFDVTCPTIDNDTGLLTGGMKGFVLMKIPLRVIVDVQTVSESGYMNTAAGLGNHPFRRGTVYGVPQPIWRLLKSIESFRYSKTTIADRHLGQFGLTDLKFNYSNVLAEFRRGDEFQSPLKYFKTIFIDHIYGRELFGPFNVDRDANDSGQGAVGVQENAPQRIAGNRKMLTRSEVLEKNATNFNLEMSNNLPVKEGSDDERRDNADDGGEGRSFSDWARGSLVNWNEAAVPVVHTVYNPNVTRVFISLNIAGLSDTLTFNVGKPDAAEDKLELGAKFPAVLNFKVETGTLGATTDGTEGLETEYRSYTYRVVALIEGNTIIDIGNPDYQVEGGSEYVVNLEGGDEGLNAGFELPPTVANKQVILSAGGLHGVEAGVLDQESTEKRYVKITKLSFETNSVLLTKQVSLGKVTEIIDIPLPYPFSAIIGTRLDSRSFSSIPRRTYDCKLKKVRVPLNYFPVLRSGKDKRYFDNQAEFDNETKENKWVYEGDWNGIFKTNLEWTDNPAWILYDLLTNERYGMGTHIKREHINIWELYKIARFCDAVDDEGYFEGVTDGRGGREPRYSCNIVFDQGQKIFDAINTIAALFRGRVFFGNSTINFVDDRPRNPVNIFTNETIKDGLFHYSNNRRDEQFNCIEVGYKDRFDNFTPQIEVVEDEDNIKERGIFKKRIEGIGITSRAMARRVAQQQIFSKITENQTVAFTAGLETLLCQPGDLIFVEDDLKTNRANFGKILDVDIDNEIIRITNTFDHDDMAGVLTVMTPTGRDSFSDIMNTAELNRTRYSQVRITGEVGAVWGRYTGDYSFSRYTAGYPEASGFGEHSGDPRHQEYALYTGLPQSGTILYYEPTFSGWVFASGTGEGGVGAFDLASGDFISESTGAQDLVSMGTGKISTMAMTGTRRASPGVAFSGFDDDGYIGPVRQGILASELGGLKPNQLTILNVTGTIFATPSELEAAGYNNYGSVLSGFDKPEVLPFIKLGSPAKVEIIDASPFIYKVTAMKEENVNEYLITATKYDTGKFKFIEDDISIEKKANTFSYRKCQTINDVTFCTLSAPTLETLTTGIPNIIDNTFSVSGAWSAVPLGTGYNVILTHPNGSEEMISVSTTGFEFEGQNTVGIFNYCVNALGTNTQNSDTDNAYFDSQYDCSGLFVVYDDLLEHAVTFINRIRIL